MTEDERAALRTLIEGFEIVPYPILLRLEEMGLAEFVWDDRVGEWCPTDEGRRAAGGKP